MGAGSGESNSKFIKLITMTDISKNELTCYIFWNNQENDVLLNHIDSRLYLPNPEFSQPFTDHNISHKFISGFIPRWHHHHCHLSRQFLTQSPSCRTSPYTWFKAIGNLNAYDFFVPFSKSLIKDSQFWDLRPSPMEIQPHGAAPTVMFLGHAPWQLNPSTWTGKFNNSAFTSVNGSRLC